MTGICASYFRNYSQQALLKDNETLLYITYVGLRQPSVSCYRIIVLIVGLILVIVQFGHVGTVVKEF